MVDLDEFEMSFTPSRYGGNATGSLIPQEQEVPPARKCAESAQTELVDFDWNVCRTI